MMKNWNKTTRVVLATLATGGALFAASSAFAQSAPYMQPAPGPVYEQPHMMPVGVSINIGWHGDRYWDGHRYWAHDEWMHHHPHDPGPQHWHDDHHPDHRY